MPGRSPPCWKHLDPSLLQLLITTHLCKVPFPGSWQLPSLGFEISCIAKKLLAASYSDLNALEQRAGSFWNVPSALFLSSTCGFAVRTWRQTRRGWLTRPVFPHSRPHASCCLSGPLRTYGWSSHHPCTSTCFHRPSCLGLT